MEGRSPGGDDHGVGYLACRRETLLELGDLRAHRQLSGLEHLRDRGELLLAEIGPREPDHAGAGWRSRYHAIVRASPSSRSTFGSHPSTLRALSMFGIR